MSKLLANCITCGKQLSTAHGVRCRKCNLAYLKTTEVFKKRYAERTWTITRKFAYCEVCGKKLTSTGCKRCRKCAYTSGYRKPNKNKQTYTCVDCGTDISNKSSGRCRKCSWDNRKTSGYKSKLLGRKRPEHSRMMKEFANSEEGRRAYSLRAGGTGVPYENTIYGHKWTKELKLDVLNRDRGVCQECGMTNEESLAYEGRGLSIHHIDYNKEHNFSANLIPLCSSCHIRTNFNRAYWKDYFQKKMQDRGLVI